MSELPSFATAPCHVRALDFGHVLVLIDYRTGHVQCLMPAAATLWKDAADTGRIDAMDPTMATRLLTSGLLLPAPSPIPWSAPTTALPAKASWGSAEHPAGTVRPPRARRGAIGAAAALASVAAIKQAGPRGLAMHRLTTALNAAASRCCRPATPAQAQAAALAVRRTGWYFPGRTACLEESAATALQLAVRRLSVTWCHGAAPDPVRLHAWVETEDGTPVAEPPSTLAFTPALTIGDRHQHQQ
ncbi:lasso peptide biosynthesis B2 protein [Streptomyces sp. NPDC057137]|uniref:lasso peptide biosynthesis B2 protein n=1 Tax=Streptomyces sp. NPDC057137 TaxID=3346030 RepID=UPI0036447DF1